MLPNSLLSPSLRALRFRIPQNLALGSSMLNSYPLSFTSLSKFRTIYGRRSSQEDFERARRNEQLRAREKQQLEKKYDQQSYDESRSSRYQNNSYINPDTVLNSDSPSAYILSQGALVITRQVEMLNIFAGFEQANRYVIYDINGNVLGYMLEEASLASTILRQVTRLHRPFRVTVFDANYRPVLNISRNFSFINSRIFVEDADGTLIGETQQQWHLFRRKYNLFKQNVQFAKIDAPFLSWQFDALDQDNYLLASVSRNFIGLATEVFTDMGKYVLRMDPSYLAAEQGIASQHSSNPNYSEFGINPRILTYDERAILLANAVSIDFDYFSWHSRH
ncbi:hypothetical protein BB560_000924 [Smittium megazygosporum]|uniref:Phospholipid scramblase n=1 Tax=Smittium megazygosporum TaxID=133381 RepID=A0A2T9ZJ05_9FUNG|nr:hypothetical protein BB560_000924 [Smittium megazygosporum]